MIGEMRGLLTWAAHAIRPILNALGGLFPSNRQCLLLAHSELSSGLAARPLFGGKADTRALYFTFLTYSYSVTIPNDVNALKNSGFYARKADHNPRVGGSRFPPPLLLLRREGIFILSVLWLS